MLPQLKAVRSLFLVVALSATLKANELSSVSEVSASTKNNGLEIFPANESTSDEKPGLVLRGADSRQQLVVTSIQNGAWADVTRAVNYAAVPAGVVVVTSEGLLTPIANGDALVTATDSQGKAITVKVRVEHLGDEIPINFSNEIVPVFTKFGCNGGGCHGKASGQNGFKLSLLGFEPREDYEHLVMESRARRISPALPESSLLLRKASGELPHGGGAKFTPEDYSYRLLKRWIEQGLPYGESTDPQLVRVEVFPKSRTMPSAATQQLVVTAVYSDGHKADVTAMAQLEPNQPSMAEVTATGWVKALDETGDVAIMARYQGMVDVFRATIPLGIEIQDMPPVRNFIDELAFAKLKTLGLPPSPICNDATFVRRVTLDLAGRLPTPTEVQAFVQDTQPEKRKAWINKLLVSSEHADYFSNKWSALLRNSRQSELFRAGTFALHAWVRQSIYENKPFDQFVRELLTSSGDMKYNPPVAWYRAVRQSHEQVEDVAQLFLGQRLQCARCHHHPFEKWSQTDYYGMAAFFSRVERKAGDLPTEEMVFVSHGPAVASHPKTGASIPATGLGSTPAIIKDGQDPRDVLVDWMVDANNPLLARSVVNRYFKHFFGRGLVEPEDDLRVTNPASNPELLDALAKFLVDNQYNLRALELLICDSTLYQLSSEPNEHNAKDKLNYSRFYPRRLPAEVLHDAINDVTGTPSAFPGLPGNTRATQLPDNGFNSYFLTVFGKPENATACECERGGDANLAQCLHLLNSAEVQQKLVADNGRAALLAADTTRELEARITELYCLAFARQPTTEELQLAKDYIGKSENLRPGLEDFTWALLNTKEFLFNH